MELIKLLILNLFIFGFLGTFIYLFSKYNKAWYLRVQREKNIYNNFFDKFILLEIKLPREVSKSPQAMEFVIDALHQAPGLVAKFNPKNDKGKYKKFSTMYDDYRKYKDDAYKQGQVRLWMTLEIESRGGEIHFYIGTQKRYKDIISSYIFSQYPGIEVTETEDYTNKIRPVMQGGEHHPWSGFGQLAGTKKSYLPIKTYVDYGLDKDPKDEFKIDPLIPLLESMANIKEDEHVWYQILLRACQSDKKVKEDAQKRIDEILGVKRYSEEDEKADPKNKRGKIKEQNRQMPSLLPVEKQEVELIQRYAEKLLFDTKIVMIYIAPRGKLRPEGDQIVRNAFKSFNNQNFNNLKIGNLNTTNSFLDYPDRRREERARAYLFYSYVSRNPMMPVSSGTGTPFKDLFDTYKKFGYRSAKLNYNSGFKEYFMAFNDEELEFPELFHMVFNSEEIATLFHFPSKAFSAPKFGRIESVKSEPPTNLPV